MVIFYLPRLCNTIRTLCMHNDLRVMVPNLRSDAIDALKEEGVAPQIDPASFV